MGGGVLELEDGFGEVSAFGVGDLRLEGDDFFFGGGGGTGDLVLDGAIVGELFVEMVEGRADVGHGGFDGGLVVGEEGDA